MYEFNFLLAKAKPPAGQDVESDPASSEGPRRKKTEPSALCMLLPGDASVVASLKANNDRNGDNGEEAPHDEQDAYKILRHLHPKPPDLFQHKHNLIKYVTCLLYNSI